MIFRRTILGNGALGGYYCLARSEVKYVYLEIYSSYQYLDLTWRKRYWNSKNTKKLRLRAHWEEFERRDHFCRRVKMVGKDADLWCYPAKGLMLLSCHKWPKCRRVKSEDCGRGCWLVVFVGKRVYDTLSYRKAWMSEISKKRGPCWVYTSTNGGKGCWLVVLPGKRVGLAGWMDTRLITNHPFITGEAGLGGIWHGVGWGGGGEGAKQPLVRLSWPVNQAGLDYHIWTTLLQPSPSSSFASQSLAHKKMLTDARPSC